MGMQLALTNTEISEVILPIYYQTRMPGFIAEEIAPFTKATKKSGKIIKFGTEFMRPLQGRAAPGVPGAVILDDYSTISFELETRRWTYPMDNDDIDESELPVEIAQRAMYALSMQAGLIREMGLAAWMTDHTHFTNSASPTVKWDATTGTRDIDKDVIDLAELVCESTGVEREELMCYTTIGPYKKMEDWVKATRAGSTLTGVPTKAEVAAHFGLGGIKIARAKYVSSARGATTTVKSPVWATSAGATDNLWIGYFKADPKGDPAFACHPAKKKDLDFHPIPTDDPPGIKWFLQAKEDLTILEETSCGMLYDILT